MATLIYASITSLDGYVSDDQGRFDWAAPDEEVHAFINARERSVGTYLYGRRMYETMSAWETDPDLADDAIGREYAEIWRAADKVVYSTTMSAVSTARTRIERHFDPEAVRRWKAEADRDLTVGGPGLAAHAIRAGVIDEYHLYRAPVVGGGTPALPSGVHVRLALVEERRFGNGMAYLRYRITR